MSERDQRLPGVVASRALPLGVAIGFHLCLLILALSDLTNHALLAEWSVFVVALGFFHTLEFVWSATFEPQSVSATAFLLDHSRAYHFTLSAAVLEFGIEAFLFPEWKANCVFPFGIVGLCLVVLGQLIRTVGMWTAGANFTHLVAEQKRSDHSLVQTGLYSILRHPAYFGKIPEILVSVLICSS